MSKPKEFLVEKAPLRKEKYARSFNPKAMMIYSGEEWIRCIEYDAYWNMKQVLDKAISYINRQKCECGDEEYEICDRCYFLSSVDN